ncbi:uncharacterized protein TEOVI_000707700 [Trypanosoma equiperdum]|uniref:Uncharacterized protein n=1 Tax=Trypanosoma equiperdum TaxID=5694 RepID=A0A1G4I8H2_TRYEQ|nr:hypothetical protein, conserved [Trypanosoma equiperdum]
MKRMKYTFRCFGKWNAPREQNIAGGKYRGQLGRRCIDRQPRRRHFFGRDGYAQKLRKGVGQVKHTLSAIPCRN